MARPIWKGSIVFGLVTVPDGLYSATERAEKLSFRLLHEKDKLKLKGKEITVPEPPPRPRVIDLTEALRQSLESGRRPRAKARERSAKPRRRPAKAT